VDVCSCVADDRLAASDREKPTTAARDRQLQEQRKRKAAAFLMRMKQSDVSQNADDTVIECASNPGVNFLFLICAWKILSILETVHTVDYFNTHTAITALR